MTYRLVAISLIVVLFSIINSSIYKIGLVSFLLIIRSVNFAKSFRTFPIAVKHGFYFCLSYKISIIKYVFSLVQRLVSSLGDIEEHTDHISHNPQPKNKRTCFKKGQGITPPLYFNQDYSAIVFLY